MNAPFLEKGAGETHKDQETQTTVYFDVPHVSYKLYKQDGQVYSYVSIPRDEELKQKIQEALFLDVGGCRFVPAKLTLDDQHLHAFAIKGSPHLAVDLEGDFAERIMQLFRSVDKGERLLYSLTLKEAEDHGALRREFAKRLAGMDPDDWRSVLWHHAKIGLIQLIQFWLEEETKGKMKPLLNRLTGYGHDKAERAPFSQRKIRSDANRYMYTEAIFLFWTEQEGRAAWFQKKLQQLMTDMQGENRLEVVKIQPDLTKVEKGYIDYWHPLLCLYQKELGQFLHLPRSAHMDGDFYVERKQKTEIPAAMLTKEPGAVPFARCLNTNQLISLSAPKSKQDLDDRVKATLLVGEQGGGKTTALVNMILETFHVRAASRDEWRQHARSVISFDVADGAVIAETLQHIPDWLLDRVVILNHADTQHPIPVNFHDILQLTGNPTQIAELETRILLDCLKDDTKTIAIERYFKNALKASYAAGQGNILDTMRILIDTGYCKEMLQELERRNGYLYVELLQMDQEFADDRNTLKAIENRISAYRTDPSLMEVIAQEPLDSINFWRWMNGDEQGAYLVLIYLPKSNDTISEACRNFLFTHYFIKIWRMMLAREMLDPEKRPETLVIVDEIHQVLGQRAVQAMFGDIFKEPRKYRVRFVFTFHGWSSLEEAGRKKEAIIKAMKEAGCDLFLLKGGDEFFKSLAGMLHPYTVADFNALMGMPYCGIFRVAVNKRSHVFQARLLEPAEMRLPKHREMRLGEIRKMPNQLGRPGELVQKRIYKELKQMYQWPTKKEKKAVKTVEIDF